MSKKNLSRMRRALKSRSKIKFQDYHRLSVFRSNKHIYAQIFLSNGSEVVVSASTSDSLLKKKNNSNIEAASKVGKLIAERAIEMGIKKGAFDRSGYKYHGRVKALANAAREAGLNF